MVEWLGWVVVDSRFEAVLTALRELPADPGEAPDGVLAERMGMLVQITTMAQAALAEQLAVFDARGAARYDGQTSTRAWLRSVLRLEKDAGLLLKVARQLAGVPEFQKAFTAGEITLEHAAAVAGLVGRLGADAVVEYESILLDLARQAPPSQLRTACEYLFQLLDPGQDADEATRQHHQRHLSAARTIDGMVHLHGRLDPISGDVVLTALQAAMPAPAEYEERTSGQRRADALVDICGGWLGSGDAPSSGGLPVQVQVTASLHALQHGGDAEAVTRPWFGVTGDVPTLADGQPIPVEQARRLACDAGIVPAVLGSRSEPLDIGRHSRVVPAGMRRALNLRDGGCRFAGCDRPATWSDAHHVRHWVDGGPTCLDNLILMCGYHHTLMHQGWRLIGDPNGLVRFARPDGTRLHLTSTPRCRPPVSTMAT